jgi:hypothetical protein
LNYGLTLDAFIIKNNGQTRFRDSRTKVLSTSQAETSATALAFIDS